MRLCTETMGRERGEGKEERERRGKREEGRGEEIMSFTVMQLKGQKEKEGREKDLHALFLLSRPLRE